MTSPSPITSSVQWHLPVRLFIVEFVKLTARVEDGLDFWILEYKLLWILLIGWRKRRMSSRCVIAFAFYVPFAPSSISTTGTLLEVITETASPGTESTKSRGGLAVDQVALFNLLGYQRQIHDCLFSVDPSNECFSGERQQCRIVAKEEYWTRQYLQ